MLFCERISFPKLRAFMEVPPKPREGVPETFEGADVAPLAGPARVSNTWILAAKHTHFPGWLDLNNCFFLKIGH